MFSLNYYTSLSLSYIHVFLKYMRNTVRRSVVSSCSRQNRVKKERKSETTDVIVRRIIIKVCSQYEPTRNTLYMKNKNIVFSGICGLNNAPRGEFQHVFVQCKGVIFSQPVGEDSVVKRLSRIIDEFKLFVQFFRFKLL